MMLSSAAYYLPQNAGDIARKYIKDPQLLSFIDAEVCRSYFIVDVEFFLLIALEPSYGISHYFHEHQC